MRYVSKELIERLEQYNWPGNVRELEHIIVYGMSMVDEDSNMLKFEDLADKFREITKQVQSGKSTKEESALFPSLKASVEQYEMERIRQTLHLTEGNLSAAARMLDIPRQTLQRKVRQYDIPRED